MCTYLCEVYCLMLISLRFIGNCLNENKLHFLDCSNASTIACFFQNEIICQLLISGEIALDPFFFSLSLNPSSRCHPLWAFPEIFFQTCPSWQSFLSIVSDTQQILQPGKYCLLVLEIYIIFYCSCRGLSLIIVLNLLLWNLISFIF